MSQRRRPVTSCVECYKRKQKCNRLQPCNHCTSRNVPEKCVFGGERLDFSLQTTPRTIKTASEERKVEAFNVLVEPAISSSLLKQVGYSSTANNVAPLHLASLGQSHVDTILGDLEKELKPIQRHADRVSSTIQGHKTNSPYALLPSHEIVLILLDLYFGEATFGFMCVDEQHFRRRYDEWRESLSYTKLDSVSSDQEHFPALLLQVLAQTIDCLSIQHEAAKALNLQDYESCDLLADRYHFAGDEIMQKLGRHDPTVTSIEHDLVSADWLKTSGRGAQAWDRLGSAIRQAQEMGLHDLPDAIESGSGDNIRSQLSSIWHLEHRKRLWIRLFIFDANLALGLGRPRLIHREDATVLVPLNCDFPYNTEQTVPIPYESCPFASTIFLLQLAYKIHDTLTLLSTRQRRRDYSAVMALHGDVCELRSIMPNRSLVKKPASTDIEQFRSSVTHLRLQNHINTIIIALHRPFVALQPTSRLLAMSAALEQLAIQEELFQLIPFPQYKLYGNVFYTIDASIFLAGVITEVPGLQLDECNKIRNTFLISMNRLSVMKQRSRIAGPGEKLLGHFYAKMQTIWSLPLVDTEPRTLDFPKSNDRALDNIISTISPLQQHSYETYEGLFGFDSSFDELLGSNFDVPEASWTHIP